jgi:hypothetical protein
MFFTSVLFVAVAVAGHSYAQDNGQFWIGGSIGLNKMSNSEVKNDTYGIYPEFGYAFSDRWAIGTRFGIHKDKVSGDRSSDVSISKTNEDIFEVAPFVRYTALKWKAFRVYVDGGLSYLNSNYHVTRIDDDVEILNNLDHASQYGIFIQPGFSLKLTPHLALTGHLYSFFSAGYERSIADHHTDDRDPVYQETNNYFVGLNLPFNLENFSVGFEFNF